MDNIGVMVRYSDKGFRADLPTLLRVRMFFALRGGGKQTGQVCQLGICVEHVTEW